MAASGIRKLVKNFLPATTLSGAVARILATNWRTPWRVGRRLNKTNFENYRKLSQWKFRCNVCGSQTAAFYDMPDVELRRAHGIGLLRETINCQACGSTLRQRALCHALLRSINIRLNTQFEILTEYVIAPNSVSIFDSDSFSPLNKILRGKDGYVSSMYLDDAPLGAEIEPNTFNINLEKISFATESFDIILTSDVMEHVRDHHQAHEEIHRCLTTGGSYIFTVPFDQSLRKTKNLVARVGALDVYLEAPHFHGDPLTGGVLAYRIFGLDLVEELSDLGFSVKYDEVMLLSDGILQGDYFVANKNARFF